MKGSYKPSEQSILPYGASTYSRSGVADPIFDACATHADGWRVFSEGRDLLDMSMGLSSVILGHRNQEVDEAIRRQLCNGTAQSLATWIEHDAAERVLAHFPDDCMLQWGVNGSDATEGACRLARIATGRRLIVMDVRGYHGFHDFALAETSRGDGINWDNNITRFDWDWYDGDPNWSDLERHAAAILIEPDMQTRKELQWLREWCDQHGALLIFDEVVTWQRYPKWLASEYYGVTPDLWCIGKSLGNGMPVSAIVGSGTYMRRFTPSKSNSNSRFTPSKSNSNTFFSCTWAGHPLSMAAVIATLDVMERENGPQKLWDKARAIEDMLILNPMLLAPKMPKFTMSGPPFNRITWHPTPAAREWRKMMSEQGVLIYNAHNVSLAFDDNAMTRLRNAWESVAEALPERLDALDKEDEERMESSIMRR